MRNIIHECPFCGHEDVQVCEPDIGLYAIDCPECEALGPSADSVESAITRWNYATQKRRELAKRASVMTELVLQHEREIERLLRERSRDAADS